MQEQGSLFAAPEPVVPPGLAFREEFVSAREASALLAEAERLPFAPFQFHGWTGNRETVSFGWRYDFGQARVEPAPPIPDFLLPLRARAADFMGLEPGALEQALVIRYDVGAGIGWHRDRPVFDQVFGLSLQSPCVLRFRRRVRPIYCAARSARHGSTASFPWKRYVIRSLSGAGAHDHA